jgi:serpin B
MSATTTYSAPGSETEAASGSVNAFAIDLYKQIRKPAENLIFSPYSISMCLAMAYAGARGETESQMAKALHFSMGQAKITKALGGVNEQVRTAGEGKNAEINIANALWAEQSFPLLKEFVESVRVNFQGELRSVDFQHQPEPVRNTINKWVEEQTKDKIKDLLAPGTFTEDTRLVLTNAIYFKGLWEWQFKKELTKEASFFLLDGKEIKVPTMGQTEFFGYAEESDLQVLEMPYKDKELSMIVLLPSKQKRLEDLEQALTVDKLGQWIGKLRTQRVEVYLPRFKMTSEFELATALAGLGMRDAFSSADADFSGITGAKDLYIEKAIHKAFVEVNEEGTEAAAATAIEVTKGVAPWLPMFVADHPFLFLIRHKPSGTILFLGRVTNPAV